MGQIPNRTRTKRQPGVVNRLRQPIIPGQGNTTNAYNAPDNALSFQTQTAATGYAAPQLVGGYAQDIWSDKDISNGVGRPKGGSREQAQKTRYIPSGIPGIGSEVGQQSSTRFGGRQNDGVSLVKNRGTYLYTGNFIGGPAQREWTRQAPVRPSLIFGRLTYRVMAGWSGQTNEGLHTYLPVNVAQPMLGTDKMIPRRQNRLTVQRYRGQSFSSQTEVLGNS